MSEPTRKNFSLRPIDTQGYWLTDDRRYREYALMLLRELEAVAEEVKQRWPVALNQTLRGNEHSSELWELVRKRDCLSDSVKVFSAMAVEGFLNYYGVIRLGEKEYTDHFERLGLNQKLRTILLFCDALSVSKNDPLVKLLDKISQRRNNLVHAKAKELAAYTSQASNPTTCNFSLSASKLGAFSKAPKWRNVWDRSSGRDTSRHGNEAA